MVCHRCIFPSGQSLDWDRGVKRDVPTPTLPTSFIHRSIAIGLAERIGRDPPRRQDDRCAMRKKLFSPAWRCLLPSPGQGGLRAPADSVLSTNRAKVLIGLIRVAGFPRLRQIHQLQRAFVEQGGLRKGMTSARPAEREKQQGRYGFLPWTSKRSPRH